MATRKTGRITERGKGVWTIRIYLGENSSGKRKHHNETFKGSKKDAQKRLTEIQREKDLGLITETRKQTLNEYLDIWLLSIAKPRLHSRKADFRRVLSYTLTPFCVRLCHTL